MQPVKRTTFGGSYTFMIIAGAILALLALAILLPLIAPLFTGSSGGVDTGGLTYSALCIVAVLIGGIGLLAVGVRGKAALARLSRPEVTISSQSPRAGEAVTLSYSQTFRTTTDVKAIRFRLILRESATHSEGKSTVTETNDKIVQEHQLPGGHFEAGHSIQEQHRFQLGDMHTFRWTFNKVEWLIHAQVEMGGLPTFAEEYPLQVLPELAR